MTPPALEGGETGEAEGGFSEETDGGFSGMARPGAPSLHPAGGSVRVATPRGGSFRRLHEIAAASRLAVGQRARAARMRSGGGGGDGGGGEEGVRALADGGRHHGVGIEPVLFPR